MDVQHASRRTALREIEIKLDLSAADAAILDASLEIWAAPQRRVQYSVYFDTADRRLFAAGFALRIRADGGRLIQTVKTLADGAGLFDRGEWELPVARFRPIPDDRVRGLSLDARLIDALVPAFEIEAARACWTIRSTAVALTIDRATIRAGERQCSFHELELELTGGDRAAAFALLGQLDGIVPLRVGVLSKAERGFRLLGPSLAAYRAERIVIAPASTVRQAFGVIAASCIKQYRLNEQTLLDCHDAEAVHQARVALRRLRSALAIFDEVLDRRARVFDRSLRSLAKALGAVRDLDVARNDAVQSPGLRRQREQAYASLAETLRRAETRALFVDIAAWLAEDTGSGPGTVSAFAADALERARRRLARRARHFANLGPAKRHRVRMAAKRLHYADDFFAALLVSGHRRRLARFSRALEKLQDRLGELNDLIVAADLTGTRLVAGEEARLMRRARRTLEQVLQAKPYWRCD
jgi:triphosphatase